MPAALPSSYACTPTLVGAGWSLRLALAVGVAAGLLSCDQGVEQPTAVSIDSAAESATRPERPSAAAEAAPVDPAQVLGGSEPTEQEDPSWWTTCRPAPLARVQRWAIPAVTPTVTVLDRLDAGWATRPVEQLSNGEQEAANGTWACRRADDGMLEVAYLVGVHAMRVGPIFGFDAVNDTVVPRNWLATVALSEDPSAESAKRRTTASSLAALANCKTPSGTPVSTGLFVYLENLDRFGGVGSPLGWFVIPNVVNDGEEFRDEVGFQRQTTSGPQAITFEVAREGCRPIGAAAEQVMQFAAGVRASNRVQLDRSLPVGSDRTSGTREALESVFASPQLNVFDDWITFHSTNRPYTSAGWQAVGPRDDESYDVGHRFTLGSDEYLLAWNVNPTLRTMTALSPLADMASQSTPASTPVRRTIASPASVNVAQADPSLGTETLTAEDVTRRIRESEDDIVVCYEREERRGRSPQSVEASWQVNPNGTASNVTLVVQGAASSRFESCVERSITSARYPSFDGPAVPARTVFSFARE